MRNTAKQRRSIVSRRGSVAVVGQGYVGLSVACEAAEAGFQVTGIDIDAGRVEALRAGGAPVPGVSETVFRSACATGRLRFTTAAEAIGGSEVVLICVPTPVRDGSPDLSHVDLACRSVAEHLQPGTLVVLESTTYPGSTEDFVRPILEGSGLLAGRDFLLAYSPERIDPGNEHFAMRQIPRIVGGMTPEATGLATLFYEQLVDKVVAVSSCRAAELAKLLENTFRHVNIALVNEMAMLCHEVEIDVWEVIDAAASKPFGFMPFRPGPGVGGHCIPVDPAYLAWQVRRDAGHQFRMLEQAQDVNARMPSYVADRVGEALSDAGKALKGARVLVLGVTYKPDIADVRESPAIAVMARLLRRGALVSFHDPYIDRVTANGDSLERSDLSLRAVSESDCVAILTPHGAYDLEWLGRHASLIFDANNAFGAERRENVVQL